MRRGRPTPTATASSGLTVASPSTPLRRRVLDRAPGRELRRRRQLQESTSTRPVTAPTPPPRSSGPSPWARARRPSRSPRRPRRPRWAADLRAFGHGHLGLAVALTIDASSTAGACSIASGVVSFTGVGSCIIDANQAGNANYNAATQVQQTVTVAKGLPDHHAHLDGPDRADGGRGLHAHGHRLVGPDRGHHRRRQSSSVCSISVGAGELLGRRHPARSTSTSPEHQLHAAPQVQQTFSVEAGPDHRLHLHGPDRGHGGRGHVHGHGHRRGVGNP